MDLYELLHDGKSLDQVEYEEGQSDGSKASDGEKFWYNTGVGAASVGFRSEAWHKGYQNGLENRSQSTSDDSTCSEAFSGGSSSDSSSQDDDEDDSEEDDEVLVRYTCKCGEVIELEFEDEDDAVGHRVVCECGQGRIITSANIVDDDDEDEDVVEEVEETHQTERRGPNLMAVILTALFLS